MKSLFFPAAKGKKILFAAVLTAVCNTLVSIVFFHCIWILQVGALFPASGLMVCFCLEMKEGRRILFLSLKNDKKGAAFATPFQKEQFNDIYVKFRESVSDH